MSRWPRWTSTD